MNDDTIIISDHLDKISKEELDFYNRALVKALGLFIDNGRGIVVRVREPFFPLTSCVLIYVYNNVLKFKLLKSNIEDKSMVYVYEDKDGEVNFINDENVIIEE